MFFPHGRRSLASLFVLCLFTLAGLAEFVIPEQPVQGYSAKP